MSDELLDKIERYIESGDRNYPTYNTDFQKVLQDRVDNPHEPEEQRTRYRGLIDKLRKMQKDGSGPLGGSTQS